MDIRIEKTKNAITNTFLELRSKKPLEKITIRELCERAKINKSTFYSHYKDIYDLSDQLETEVVTSVIESMQHPEKLFEDPAAFTKGLFLGYLSTDALIQILFSGSRSGELVRKIECQLRKLIFSSHPEYEADPIKNIIITYNIYGGYYAFQENRNYGESDTVAAIAQITRESLKLL